MRISPEFRRNLWLQLTPMRLWAVPGVILSIFLIIFLIQSNSTDSEIEAIGRSYHSASLLIIGFVTVIVGTVGAALGVLEEIKNRTWDQQRLTSMRPWEMTWGKILGRTALSWYVAMWTIPFALFGALTQESEAAGFLVAQLVLFLIWGLMAHATGLLLSLISLQKNRKAGTIAAIGLSIVALFYSGFATLGPYSDVRSCEYLDFSERWACYSETYSWYSLDYNTVWFPLLIALVFAGWSLFGSYRAMSKELQFEIGPWGWLGFVVFQMFFLPGFITADDTGGLSLSTARMGMAIVIAGAAFYLTLFNEPKKVVDYRKLQNLWKRGNLEKFWLRFPAWGYVYGITSLAAITYMLQVALFETEADSNSLLIAGVVSAGLFTLRDVGLVLFFNIREKLGGDGWALFSLFLLYGVIPFLITILLLVDSSNDSLIALAPFWPVAAEEGWLIGVTPIAIQVIAIGFLVSLRWKAFESRVKTVPSTASSGKNLNQQNDTTPYHASMTDTSNRKQNNEAKDGDGQAGNESNGSSSSDSGGEIGSSD